MKQQFTQDEANAILMRAVEHQPLRESVTWEQLVAVAAEIGVSEETLRQAQFSLQSEPRSVEAERTRFQKYQRDVFKARIKCVLHLTAFLIGSFILIGVNSETSDEFPWALGFIIPWLMILVYHWRYVRLTMGDAHEEAFLRWMRVQRGLATGHPDDWAAGTWSDARGTHPVR